MDRLMAEYLTYLETSRGLSPHTLTAVRQDFSKWEEFLAEEDLTVPEVQAPQASGFLAQHRKRGLSPLSVNRIASSLRGFYRYLVRSDRVATNPFSQVRNLKAGRRLPSLLQPQDLGELLEPGKDEFRETRDRMIFEILYATGCRASELLSLNVDQMTRETLRIRGKGDKERLIFLSAEAIQAWEAYRPHREKRVDGGNSDSLKALILNHRGHRLGAMGLSVILKRNLKEAGIWQKVTPHTFRHTFATHLLNEGMDIRHLQELLGHSQLSTTQIYTHLSLDKLRSALEQAHPHGGKKQ